MPPSSEPTPRLRIGLTKETDYSPTVWFLATLPRLIPPSVVATAHFGLFHTGPVLVPLFFVKLTGDFTPFLIENSLNPYHHELHGLALLRRLGTQLSYHLHYRQPTETTGHILEWPNLHQDLYQHTVHVLEAHAPWTDRQFVDAQLTLAHAWPTPAARFEQLRRPSDHSFTMYG